MFGEFYRKVFSLSIPLIIQYLCESLYVVFDTYFISILGKEYVAGVTVSSYVIHFVYLLLSILFIGLTVYASQCFGAKDFEKIRIAYTLSIITGVLISSIMILVCIFFTNYITYFIVPNVEVSILAHEYLSIFSISFIGSTVFIIIVAVFDSFGLTKISAIYWILSDILNIIFDPILIFGYFGFPELGIKGAAIATNLAIYIPLPFMYIHLKKYGIYLTINVFRKFKDILKRILYIGVPACIERLIAQLLFITYGSLIGRYGVTIFTAYQIGLRIESFVFLPIIAIMHSSSILIGQEIGKENYKNAYELAKTCIKTSILFTIISIIITYLVSINTIHYFTNDKDVQNLALIYLYLAFIADFGFAISLTISGIFRGIGDSITPMIINTLSMLIFRILPAIYFTIVKFPAIYLWYVMVFELYLRAFIHYIVFTRTFFKKIKKLI